MVDGSDAEIETNSQGPMEVSLKEDNITERPPLHSKDFFALHLAFAQKVQQLTGVNLDQALMKDTPLYNSFELGHDFNPQNPEWQSFLTGLSQVEDKVGFIHSFYKEQAKKVQVTKEEEKHFGCFSYDYIAETKGIRIHFGNRDSSGKGPLDSDNLNQRRAELVQMFQDIKSNHPEAQIVTGSSWLYNIPAYRNLFPDDFTQNLQVAENKYHRYDLWGQFLKRDGSVREDAAAQFLQKVNEAKSEGDLKNAFPVQALKTEAPISSFYKLYQNSH